MGKEEHDNDEAFVRALEAESVELAEAREALTRSQRATAQAKAKTTELVAAVYQAARDARVAVGPVPRWKKPPVPSEGQLVPLLHTTDWQLGKKTASYDMDTCGSRLEQMMEISSHLTADVTRARKAGPAHIMLGGDMVEGTTIFPGQVWEIEADLYTQLFTTVKYICAIIDRGLELWGHVTVWEEKGNHGRLGKKGEQPGGDNIDRIAYTIARERYKDHPDVVWHPIDHDMGQIIEIGRYSALLVHGDEIQMYSQHPVHAIQLKVTRWQTIYADEGLHFVDCYMGHFHRPDTYTLPAAGSIFLTGSTESGSEFAKVQMASLGRPSQRLHFIHPDDGFVWSEHRLWLD